jgi:carbon storage regulator
MLNITRRRGERIVVGDDVFVSVLEVSGQTVRLGIEAPRSVRVYREEIWLEVKRENEAAAQAASASLPELPAPLRTPGGGGAGSAGSAGTAVNRTPPPSTPRS